MADRAAFVVPARSKVKVADPDGTEVKAVAALKAAPLANENDMDYTSITIKIPPGVFEGIKLLAQRQRIPLEVKASALLQDMILRYEEIYDDPAGPDGPIGLQAAMKYFQEKRQKEAEPSRRPLPPMKVIKLNVGEDGTIHAEDKGFIE